eukprot:CAMPEP_0170177066 /NCGR_PEP_ID=MMETSP0040_2-20121228/9797_1 /TAXON_ID=641309 /ORGANISM="Lotharella oceanica, Strain CCMP622" /LENGTH=163 /DNA_ID=CAMNT_0010419579 /DNA_START=15 /DNA_END=506 /DNA_ORIENTATION=-
MRRAGATILAVLLFIAVMKGVLFSSEDKQVTRGGSRIRNVRGMLLPRRVQTTLPPSTKARGLPPSRCTYTVTLMTPDGEIKLQCPYDQYILDRADEEGHQDLPYSCRAGLCYTCTGRVVSGEVDNSEQNMLNDDEMARGLILTCCAYPNSDVVIETHMESEVI